MADKQNNDAYAFSAMTNGTSPPDRAATNNDSASSAIETARALSIGNKVLQIEALVNIAGATALRPRPRGMNSSHDR